MAWEPGAVTAPGAITLAMITPSPEPSASPSPNFGRYRTERKPEDR